MLPTVKTRKPVVKLSSTDLRTFPVWEYALDEECRGKQDETWVRPVDRQTVRKGAYSQIVASDFVTSSGRKLQGFMVVTTASDPISIGVGAIVGAVGYRVLPALSRSLAKKRRADWSIREREQFLLVLGEREERVFPLKFTLRVAISGETTARCGTLR